MEYLAHFRKLRAKCEGQRKVLKFLKSSLSHTFVWDML